MASLAESLDEVAIAAAYDVGRVHPVSEENAVSGQ
jgi:hypothetical protein